MSCSGALSWSGSGLQQEPPADLERCDSKGCLWTRGVHLWILHAGQAAGARV